MQLAHTLTRKWTDRYALIVFSGLMPVVLGIVIIVWQANRSLELTSRHTAEEAVRQFDGILDNAARAANVVLPLAGEECSHVELALRDQVTRRPFVRSVNLIQDNQIYCTSLFGSFNEPVYPQNYAGGELWLMPGNPVTPNDPLLIYRQQKDSRGVLVSIYGFHLIHALGQPNQRAQLIFQAGDNWIDRSGNVHPTAPPLYPVANNSVPSTHYPYRVVAGFRANELWHHVIAEYLGVLVLLFFLGGISATIVHRLKKRASSPTHELQRGLEAQEFIPYFQPVVHGDSQQWAGAEVLMRWQHPQEGLVRPDLFIPFAEHSGLIIPMTRSLMQQTAALLAPHVGSLQAGFHVGFNITARHCENLDLIEDCREFLQAFPKDHIRLVLELTERELIAPTDITHALFAKLHAMGITIAIDDFGTGHSSLTYLRDFNVDYLKIDKSFVAMIGADALSRHILDSIIELSAKLDLKIVAEGIETEEQRDYLASKGVDFLQGYLFSRPLPASDFISALKARLSHT
ncbi:EAL domain-containing protein [Pseudomonas sp.]|uniref:EAL domain-containing protein n=1 Tax=Pseudomonas sp. TaxID=306 RepID=UPI002626385F|nr:EAL domain-containing protein [Pseudomonas sp.]